MGAGGGRVGGAWGRHEMMGRVGVGVGRVGGHWEREGFGVLGAGGMGVIGGVRRLSCVTGATIAMGTGVDRGDFGRASGCRRCGGEGSG